MTRTQRFLPLMAAAVLSLAAGCGTDRSPMAAGEPTFTQTADGRTFLTFSPEATERAGKIAVIPATGITVSKSIGAWGGKLEVEDRNHIFSLRDDIKVEFSVPWGALASSTQITMTVYGNTLETLVVEFAPSGLNFSKNAKLELRIGADLVSTPISQILAWHQHGDGSLTQAIISTVLDLGFAVFIEIEVPGFSRYSMGGGD